MKFNEKLKNINTTGIVINLKTNPKDIASPHNTTVISEFLNETIDNMNEFFIIALIFKFTETAIGNI